MTKQNLSESLFKPKFKHRETSTLVKYTCSDSITVSDSELGEKHRENWYRKINWLAWIWRGVDPLEIQDVLSRIAVTDAERSIDHLLDTVVGYRRGNWTFEWSQRAMHWQQEALRAQESAEAGAHWVKASALYSIAAYPHLRGDELADQAIALANKAYENAARFSDYELKKLDFQLEGGKPVTGLLHLPADSQGPCPTILVCTNLDNVQSDCLQLFREHFSPLGFAMLTLDIPSVGYSGKFTLTQDTCALHQQVLQQLDNVPWIDHTRIGVFGFRFGANIAVRLAYLEPKLIKGVAVLGPVVHELLHDKKLQQKIPPMYFDVLASRLGIGFVDKERLHSELSCYSLKNQGLLGRRCTVPMLSVYWEDDIFSPRKDSRLIAMSSMDGSLRAIPAKSVYSGFKQSLHEISVWLEDKVL
ncbi:fermentation/respiration switch protein [Xenorhabdus mauleonii]|uniref:Esterase FrsA n=1 Tax=Xenorhabdus mauleonii TaxID=351675 RepID=A0A1I3SVQ2_9GAMM|nr:esterase FrsA [Xenorhabdus mauleonii]PHM44629.1 fermentation/respiration switch protein [Xenorhabdus mauleonii]SFJ62443.1 esterase FrsA [Xenorhabdus mauleonii]